MFTLNPIFLSSCSRNQMHLEEILCSHTASLKGQGDSQNMNLITAWSYLCYFRCRKSFSLRITNTRNKNFIYTYLNEGYFFVPSKTSAYQVGPERKALFTSYSIQPSTQRKRQPAEACNLNIPLIFSKVIQLYI